MNMFHLSLATLMLITGSINTLSVKWADTMTSESSDGQQRGFDHPFLQACGMFLGEMMCMVAYYALRWRRQRALARARDPDAPQELGPPETPFSPLIFLPPAMCDMTATSIQYIGLTLTYASSFQMLRGAVIIFTGLFSRIFLRRRFQWFKWFGIGLIIIGLAVVGLCDMLYLHPAHHKNETLVETQSNLQSPLFHAEYYGGSIQGLNALVSESNKSSSDVLLGDILIVCAQVIVATQMVYEEKFLAKYDVPPLQAVGWEGTFGFLTLATLLIPMYFIPVGPKFGNNPRHVLEDAYDGLYQLFHNGQLMTAFCGTVVSIAFFNFAGISVTKEMSATTRMVLDSVRTMVIWGVSLMVGWQRFHVLQLLGFALLVCGMCIYNDLVFAPGIKYLRGRFCTRRDPYANLDNESEETGPVEPERSIYERET
ncbi:solute carrier family 35 member F6-like [Tigriopus californicus]|uniref:solute carrier family 35 member F6-like n=1 Tax=Tigriopus californicus TaxID=6832 RepID=UPI0027DA6C7D|nr:solute carrier family 35 member F6-like [Tigriopus californicus]|eukprot:TCALIF_06590-PA protein Name:"Similar to SLC35F6 Solute carrier family 35 member F6 (Pongo abelii)" AED:0.06 eAED:0.08 QI:85/1/0.8/1/1/1/5/222/425